jgi:hypothetical protein
MGRMTSHIYPYMKWKHNPNVPNHQPENEHPHAKKGHCPFRCWILRGYQHTASPSFSAHIQPPTGIPESGLAKPRISSGP